VASSVGGKNEDRKRRRGAGQSRGRGGLLLGTLVIGSWTTGRNGTVPEIRHSRCDGGHHVIPGGSKKFAHSHVEW